VILLAILGKNDVKTDEIKSKMTKRNIIIGSIIAGLINLIINSTRYWYAMGEQYPTIFLTQDSISSTVPSVFSKAVPLAVSLCFFVTSIAFLTTKMKDKPSYFPGYFLKALKHCVFAFGLVTIFAVLFQKYFGAIEVSHRTASIVTGIVSGFVATLVDYETKTSLHLDRE
jgi:hypothetical protein